MGLGITDEMIIVLLFQNKPKDTKKKAIRWKSALPSQLFNAININELEANADDNVAVLFVLPRKK